MNRRIAGLALDGRHDLAAVDWDEEGAAQVRVVQGGTLSNVITTLDDRLIGGPQAALAPHGRGGGWGPDVGAATRRRPLATAVDANGHGAHAADLAAAIDALARGAQEVILAVPDLPGFDEVAQGTMIAAARKSSARSVRLLWRPVAAMLSLIHDRRLSTGHLGQRFRFLIHSAHGIEDQTLTLREDPDTPGHVAPQRDGPGRIWAAGLGLDALFARADRHVRSSNRVPWEQLEPSRLGPRLVVGQAHPSDMEVLRHNFGRWEVVAAPKLHVGDLLTVTQPNIPAPNTPCERTFFFTPLQSALAADLATFLGVDASLETDDHIARGCLHAGRLIELGLPHYFDRLEAISIAVLREREPSFVPLIPEGHLVAANREYVSEDLRDFVWPRNKSETDFYILKGKAEVREWTVRKDSAPQTDVPIRMRIRQTPGQSWAVLDITATDWDLLARAPEKLDWEGLTPTDMSPEQLLDLLRTPPPSIPERLVEPAHQALWTGADWAGDDRAARLASDAAWTGQVDAASWAKVLSRSQRHPVNGISYRRVTTDGALPDGLPELMRNGFEVMLKTLSDRLLHGPPSRDNHALRALTWSFAACPAEVQDATLDALEADRRGHQ